MPFYEVAGFGKESGRQRKPRRYFAKSETLAVNLAKKEGIEVEAIELVDVWGCVVQVAGCSHKNDDGTSRQSVLNKIKPRDPLLLVYELGNKYDKHATKVLRINNEQLGYLPQHNAHNLIEGYFSNSGCNYWAANLGVERMDDDTQLMTARILVLVSIPNIDGVPDKVEKELSRLKISEISAESVNWQPLRSIQRTPKPKDQSKQIHLKKEHSKKKQESGCLIMMTFMLCLFTQVISLLVFNL